MNAAAIWICLLLGAFIFWLFMHGYVMRGVRQAMKLMEDRIARLEAENLELKEKVTALEAKKLFPWNKAV